MTDVSKPKRRKMAPAGADYRELVAQLDIGKVLPDAKYVHASALPGLSPPLRMLLEERAKKAGVTLGEQVVLKLSRTDARVSFLEYPDFWTAGFPHLRRSTVVSCDGATEVSVRSYESETAPVLHRKEEMLPLDHPRGAEFRALTADAERLGLFDDVASIGHRIAWEERLSRVGVALDGHRLVEAGDVQRHRTALTRYGLSTPMQMLWRHGFLNGNHSIFDYGCGRGDDIAALRSRGLTVAGWDPHFAPAEPRLTADVVNLGFVLNVIENQTERRAALEGAFALAQRVLVVGVLIGGRSAYEKYRLFRDGVLTARGTFQKYFTQAEFCGYLEEVLHRQPIPVAPGIAFVFKTDEDEQRFLVERELQRPRAAMPRPTRERPTPGPRPIRLSKWETHLELLDAYWASCAALGRQPEADEFPRWDELRALGTPKAIFRRLVAERGDAELKDARESRMGGLSVYLALALFERRKSFASLPASLKRDIKGYWGSYDAAKTEAELLLYACGKAEAVKASCAEAASRSLGYLAEDRFFQTAGENVPLLPPLLRIYLGCASQLAGGTASADVVAIDIDKAHVQLLNYDAFEDDPFPCLVESIRVGLRKLFVDFTEFDPGNPAQERVLYFKSRLLSGEHPCRSSQFALEERLRAAGVLGDGRRPMRSYLRTHVKADAAEQQQSDDLLTP